MVGDHPNRSGAHPSWDRDAERAVLGAILLDVQVIDEVEVVLEPTDLFLELHQQIFEAMRALRSEGKGIDAITVPARMKELRGVDEVEARTYVAGLDIGLASPATATHYAEIVWKHALRRQIRAAGMRTTELADDATLPIERVTEAVEQLVFAATQRTRGRDLVKLAELLKVAYREIGALVGRPAQSVTGLATGITGLDELTTGLHPGQLIVVAGRPGTGKTTLAMNFAVYAATRRNAVVAVFSLEMPEQELVRRLLASESGVGSENMRRGNISTYHWKQIDEHCARLVPAPLFIDDSSPLSVSQLASKARRLKSREGALGLIVVDYLQLLDAASLRREGSRAEEVSVISRSLKQLAKELQVPVVAAAQLSREVEKSPGKKPRRPRLSDLRESGGIEQDADVVLFLHNPKAREETHERYPEIEIVIGKQRNGPTGEILVLFQKDLNRFVNLADPAEIEVSDGRV
jgi:replicative DNA helicase